MKRLLNTIITSLGAIGLLAVVAPSEAAAQQCRSSSSYGYSYSSGRQYAPSYTQTRVYRAKKSRVSSQKRYVRTPRKTTRKRTTTVRPRNKARR